MPLPYTRRSELTTIEIEPEADPEIHVYRYEDEVRGRYVTLGIFRDLDRPGTGSVRLCMPEYIFDEILSKGRIKEG